MALFILACGCYATGAIVYTLAGGFDRMSTALFNAHVDDALDLFEDDVAAGDYTLGDALFLDSHGIEAN